MKNTKNILIEKLHAFENHPYKVQDNEEMERLSESIREHGVLSPIIVRPKENTEDEYEIISGHRRVMASQKAGIKEVPALIVSLDRDAAAIVLVDSNLHREHILPSEKAFAYKMKADAMAHQGWRSDLTSCQVGAKLRTDEQIAVDSNESARQVQRYIRLTNLIPEILEYVDEGRISFTPAVELSYLNEQEQYDLLEQMEINDCTPSLSQALSTKSSVCFALPFGIYFLMRSIGTLNISFWFAFSSLIISAMISGVNPCSKLIFLKRQACESDGVQSLISICSKRSYCSCSLR